MTSSQNIEKDIMLAIYKENQTVFRLIDVAMLTNESDFMSLNKKLNYYVKTGKLGNPRKGIYTKPGFNPEELACKIYTPSYISLQFVLQKAGIIFQYDSRITSVSYLNRTIEIEKRPFIYRKIKGITLINTMGIFMQNNHVNIASAERACLDFLYLEKDYNFDNLNPLNKEFIFQLLPLYQSKTLTIRVKKLFQND